MSLSSLTAILNFVSKGNHATMDLKTWNEHVRTRHEPREPRIDWSEVKGRTDLAGVATNLLGPAHQAKGNAYFGRVRSTMIMTQASRLI